MERLRLCFLSILGEPGTYDASVYDDIGGDDEGVWFSEVIDHITGVEYRGFTVSHGAPIPSPGDGDIFVLGGSYNSVHDDYAWQRDIYRWLDSLRAANKPLLAICGGHQMICHHLGMEIKEIPSGVAAGTLPIILTEEGKASQLFTGMEENPLFHFANFEHVTAAPPGSTVLAMHERVPVAALDYGDHWFSTQFHPEATVATLSRAWQGIRPELGKTYAPSDAGVRLIENFIQIAGRRTPGTGDRNEDC